LASDLDGFDSMVDLAVIRIGGYEGKENIRRSLAFACAHVRAGGAILVVTHMKRGAKTQMAMLAEMCGNAETLERGSGGFRMLPDLQPRAILDFGCGYGVMGVVLARRFPAVMVTMVDIDVGAVQLARQNAELNGVDARTRVVLSDGLRELPGERFDLAVIHFP